mgnify:CR=1 FL=1
MRDGFVRVASVTPDIRVCDVTYNKENIKKAIEKEWEHKSKIICMLGGDNSKLNLSLIHI